MIGSEFIEKFQNMVDDSLDTDFMYQLLNDAKDELEAEREWEQLKYETSYSVTSGYSYTSALSTLPTRFLLPLEVTESGSNAPYDKFDFTDHYGKQFASYGYFIDLAGGNFHLTGVNHGSKTVYFSYTAGSADIDSSGTWAFPSRFHQILPLKMAQLYYAADAGERGRSWDDKWQAQYDYILGRMFVWDDKLKLTNRRPRNGYARHNPAAISY